MLWYHDEISIQLKLKVPSFSLQPLRFVIALPEIYQKNVTDEFKSSTLQIKLCCVLNHIRKNSFFAHILHQMLWIRCQMDAERKYKVYDQQHSCRIHATALEKGSNADGTDLLSPQTSEKSCFSVCHWSLSFDLCSPSVTSAARLLTAPVRKLITLQTKPHPFWRIMGNGEGAWIHALLFFTPFMLLWW